MFSMSTLISAFQQIGMMAKEIAKLSMALFEINMASGTTSLHLERLTSYVGIMRDKLNHQITTFLLQIKILKNIKLLVL